MGKQINLLIKDRGTGKTTGLIYASEATGYPIVTTLGMTNVEFIKKQASEMGCIIPEPMTVREFNQPGRINPENVLIDEVDNILQDALNAYLNTNVICATLTDKKKEAAKIENGRKDGV